MDNPYYTSSTFEFLRALAANNDREWFQAHRADYERHVRRPGLRLIADVAAPLQGISPHLDVDTERASRCLIRIQRDLRFSADKRPYKGHTGVYIRHVTGEDSHSPGFYLRLDPARSFLSAGVWKPRGPAAAAIRTAIAARHEEWVRLISAPAFTAVYRMDEEMLARPPRGFDLSHPGIDELRRRSFAAERRFSQAAVGSPAFIDQLVDDCRRAAPLLGFLCRALGLPF